MIGSRADLAVAFARRIETIGAGAAAARRPWALAIPGGSVADTFLPGLRAAAVDWAPVHVFWADERAVPAGSPDSNVGLAERLWLDALAVPPTLHRPWPGPGDPDAAARQYETTLVEVLGDPPILDLVLLGVGPDGHVASLFPGHQAVRERHRRVVAIDDAPKPPPRRLTMTLPVLAAARVVIVAAFGAEKAAAIAEATGQPLAPSPLAQLLQSAPHAELWMDPAAASR